MSHTHKSPGCGPAVGPGCPSSRGRATQQHPWVQGWELPHASLKDSAWRLQALVTANARDSLSSKFYRARRVSGSIPFLMCHYLVYLGEESFNLRRTERAKLVKRSYWATEGALPFIPGLPSTRTAFTERQLHFSGLCVSLLTHMNLIFIIKTFQVLF